MAFMLGCGVDRSSSLWNYDQSEVLLVGIGYGSRSDWTALCADAKPIWVAVAPMFPIT